MPDSHRLPARYYARLCDTLAQSGIDVAPLLDTAGIAYRDLRAPDGDLPMARVEALVDAATDVTSRTDLAFDLGRALKLTSHSTVSYGILSSPTIGYALHLVARFFGLILPALCMRYATHAQHMQITVAPLWPMSSNCLTFHLELVAVAVHWEVHELLGGDLPPYDLYLALDEPPYAARYDELRNLRVHFGWQARPGFRMRWPLEVAKRPLALADSIALQLAEQRCSEMVNRARHIGHVGDWVAMMLREASGGLPALTELAHALNLSPRTLDRYLKKEGVSYRALSKQARQAKAHELLADRRLSITQVGLELGYTDASNFARAFKRESGFSPGDWRARYVSANQ